MQENQHKASISDDADHLKLVGRFVGNLTLEQVHNGSLLPFIKARREAGRKTKTINQGRRETGMALLTQLLKEKLTIIPESYRQQIEQTDAEMLLKWGGRVLKAKGFRRSFCLEFYCAIQNFLRDFCAIQS